MSTVLDGCPRDVRISDRPQVVKTDRPRPLVVHATADRGLIGRACASVQTKATHRYTPQARDRLSSVWQSAGCFHLRNYLYETRMVLVACLPESDLISLHEYMNMNSLLQQAVRCS